MVVKSFVSLPCDERFFIVFSLNNNNDPIFFLLLNSVLDVLYIENV